MRARSARPGAQALGVALAVLAIGVEEGGALIEPSNVCQDEVRTDVLFAAGAFHACSAKGRTLASTQGPADYKRTITCWGWGDFGQLWAALGRPWEVLGSLGEALGGFWESLEAL